MKEARQKGEHGECSHLYSVPGDSVMCEGAHRTEIPGWDKGRGQKECQ